MKKLFILPTVVWLFTTINASTAKAATQVFAASLTSENYIGDSMYIATMGSFGGRANYIPTSSYRSGTLTMSLDDSALAVTEQRYQVDYNPFTLNFSGQISVGFGAAKFVTASLNFTNFSMQWVADNDIPLSAMGGGDFRFDNRVLNPLHYEKLNIAGNFIIQSEGETVQGNFSETANNQIWSKETYTDYNHTPPILKTSAYPSSVIFDEGVGRQQSISHQLDGNGITFASGSVGGIPVTISSNYFLPRLPNQVTLFAIPEPSTGLMLMAALTTFAGIRFRSIAQKS